ncbi:sodium-dependent transporter [Vibrio genomosp. F6]|uniref:sodium-dependent transporter n=1 Tax=Vibrio TaxID=662 RepID=UPI000DEA6824|nr:MULTISPECIES: sodium-dependent transporter [Vibrio]MDN3698535.1 sodium-dependent transporter [Vibrio cortegadensis]NOH83171.1 sodium-dependent transporter [Vibrio sp. 03-59-1]RBW66579.1 sodium-dependent transporter [Vibrionales bacterium C3R12]TKF19768.1 sodium-dependent transporter [Vibrio genomosp. F6]
MASSSRGQFSSKFGFIMAAAGSAVGLGNIWGFPTQAASNGGAVFLIVYLLMVFLLAFPMLVAELTIGRYGQSNPIASLKAVWPKGKAGAIAVGLAGMTAVSLILSFYAIVAGWLIGSFAGSGLDLLGMNDAADWLTGFGTARNLILMVIFMLLTMYVVRSGVADGIERWSTRLMPVLFGLFGLMIIYIFTQDGAVEGLKMYLVPDFSHFSADLVVSAMGQAFFSLSLGVCTMMVYGSYLKKDTNLPKTAAQVALVDTGVAFGAGLLILPAMFVAKNNGVEIFSESGALLSSDTLVFAVLPAMFDTMGTMGIFVSLVFFLLMIIAALTSSISMLEVPVACATEELKQSRTVAVAWIGTVITVVSSVIVLNFGDLFGFVIQLTTVYAQPIIGLFITLIAGWIWHRNSVLEELKQGYPEIESGLFWKVWPLYVRVVCPVLMLMVFFA